MSLAKTGGKSVERRGRAAGLSKEQASGRREQEQMKGEKVSRFEAGVDKDD
jgi:hypothetical protein